MNFLVEIMIIMLLLLMMMMMMIVTFFTSIYKKDSFDNMVLKMATAE